MPSSDGHWQRSRQRTKISSLLEAAALQYKRFTSLTGKFMPMVVLFFLLAFVNTILDSLKDTLVITAAGGGAQVIPYLTVYAVLPSSLIFLLLYSTASQHLTRPVLFNAIVGIFMGFFTLFAFVLYPNHQALHPHQFADRMAEHLPSGLYGLVGMVRNWTFTLFFCMSELWGDVCLGLLFWGLANDTTSLSDAHTLYPLFGLGANMAQAIGGMVLKMFSSGGTSAASFASQIQGMMFVVLGISMAALGMHAYIDHREQLRLQGQQQLRQQRRLDARLRQEEQQRLDHELYLQQLQQRLESNGDTSSSSSSGGSSSGGEAQDAGENGKFVSRRQLLSSGHAAKGGAAAAAPSTLGSGSTSGATAKQNKPSLAETFSVLASSIPIQCLAVMSLAQGLCSSLMEFAWKGYMKLLLPAPADFTAFLGDVSTWQGLVTGGLMILSPAMFARMGWKGVAAATPQILLVGGVAFFGACMFYQYMFAAAGAAAVASEAASATLAALVYGGAALYVFSKSAKFSLFKPAEEMVYISLDEEGRTKGKAAIDVVSSQAGKSGGSMLQQLLLLASGGIIGGSLPIMFGVYLLMANGWLRSVEQLSDHNPRYGHPETVHPTLTGTGTDADDGTDSDLSGMESDADSGSGTAQDAGKLVSGNGHGNGSVHVAGQPATAA